MGHNAPCKLPQFRILDRQYFQHGTRFVKLYSRIINSEILAGEIERQTLVAAPPLGGSDGTGSGTIIRVRVMNKSRWWLVAWPTGSGGEGGDVLIISF